MTKEELLKSLSKRLFWWELDESDLTERRIIIQTLDRGALEDWQALLSLYTKAELLSFLHQAVAGEMHPKSWNFAHLYFAGFDKPVPPMPTRYIPV